MLYPCEVLTLGTTQEDRFLFVAFLCKEVQASTTKAFELGVVYVKILP